MIITEREFLASRLGLGLVQRNVLSLTCLQMALTTLNLSRSYHSLDLGLVGQDSCAEGLLGYHLLLMLLLSLELLLLLIALVLNFLPIMVALRQHLVHYLGLLWRRLVVSLSKLRRSLVELRVVLGMIWLFYLLWSNIKLLLLTIAKYLSLVMLRQHIGMSIFWLMLRW